MLTEDQMRNAVFASIVLHTAAGEEEDPEAVAIWNAYNDDHARNLLEQFRAGREILNHHTLRTSHHTTVPYYPDGKPSIGTPFGTIATLLVESAHVATQPSYYFAWFIPKAEAQEA